MTLRDPTNIDELERAAHVALVGAESTAEPKLASSFALTAVAAALLLLHDDFRQLRELEREIVG
jgi:hypothetical protein